MEEGTDKNSMDREEIFSKTVRAGKRTYFFDVKSTRQNDFYLTITESKKRFTDDGKFSYDKHKIFLYKEDFEKFVEGLSEVVDYIKENSTVVEQVWKERKPETSDEEIKSDSATPKTDSSFTDVNFEDLDR
jgi:Protein of unknown function (DUF3276)